MFKGGPSVKKFLVAVILLVAGASPALADNCSAYPYTLQNGQVADANQVMSNFNSILSCGNNQLLGKNANLSDVQSASSSRTNLGLGSAAVSNATNSGQPLTALYGSVVSGNVPAFINTSGSLEDSGVSAADVLTKSGNLAGIGSASTARGNLGLGSIATSNVTFSTSAPSGSANNGDIWYQYAP